MSVIQEEKVIILNQNRTVYWYYIGILNHSLMFIHINNYFISYSILLISTTIYAVISRITVY